MELWEQQVESQPSLTLPWAETLIMPVGDIQYGAQGVDLDKLKRHMEWGMKQDAYFVGMGDYVDVASPSNRRAIQLAGFYDSVTDAMGEIAVVHLERVMDALKGTEDRWFGLIEGHHYFQFEDGRTSDTILAEKLRTPFLGTCAIVNLKFRDDAVKGRHTINCQMWVHHGAGSGATMAAPLNKLEKMMSRFPTVDIFLLGHYSRKVGYPVDALVPVFGKHPRLRAKRRILACTGGFMKGYTVGSQRGGRPQGSYVEKAMMSPTNLGGVLIKVRPVHTENEDRLDMNIEL
ncbi:hypothetical protein LCGC14_1403780 [marine sediment metagenome]|uniref:Calcineurin-like phosphoesterase domain-containing protein n=1 Tax=marine sediment metagenome TaxID=412755 RepID=A0A0F9MXW4_9ZZZZ